jgi:hypothetical protein
MPGTITVGGLVINLAAETSQLKTDMAEGMRTVDAGAKAMINSMTGVTESSDRATDAGARMVKQLKEEIATFGMSSQELQLYKANLNGVGGEVESLMQRLNAMKAAQAGYSDQVAASEAAATQRIREMVAASMAEVSALGDVATATQGVTNAQAAAISTGRTLAETQRLQALNMQGVAASMKTVADGTVAMSAETQRILAQYDPLGAKLRALQADLATLRKEMGNSVDPAAIKAFQSLEDEIAKTQRLMAQAAAQATALSGSTSQLTLTQTQLIDRFKQQADTIGMSRSQLMAYQAAQAGVTEQTKQAIAAVKAHEEAIKAAAKAKEEERNANQRLSDGLQLLAAGYAALKIGEYIKDSAMLAARYETLDVVMGVVGRTAGYTKTQMDATAQAVAKQGITMTESRNNVIKLVQAHVDLSHASDLARIAQDAAVIGNINSSEAFERLVNGVARGNVLILRNIGINVNLQSAYAQMADSLGKSTLQLTENERVQARLNAVLERGTDIAGTYEAAMDTASKQITSMKRYTEDLRTTFGEVFTESLTIGVMALTDGLKDANGEINELAKNDQLADWGRDVTDVFVKIANTVDNVWIGMRRVALSIQHDMNLDQIKKRFAAELKEKDDRTGTQKFFGQSTAVTDRINAERNIAVGLENAEYEKQIADLGSKVDRFERSSDERRAARLAKKKKDADERLKVDQDYATRATALLIANANKSVEEQRAAQAKLAKEVYQGTPTYRDSEERATKPKVDQADNTRLQDTLARIEKEAAAEKQSTEQQMKLDDMRHKAGEMLDDEYYARRRDGIGVLAMIDADMYQKELAALRGHHNSTQAEEAKNQKAIHDIIDKQNAANNKAFFDQQSAEEEERLRQKKQYDDAVKATLGDGASTIKGLNDQIEKQREHNAEIGKTKEQVELAKQAQVDLRTTQLQSDADYLRDGLAKWELDDQSRALFQIRLTNLDEEIARRRTLAGLLQDGAEREAIAAASKSIDQYLSPTKAENFGNSLKKGLSGAARALVDLSGAMEKYGAKQAANDKARAEAQVLLNGNDADRAKGLKDLEAINAKGTKAQLAGYGDMAGAAASFFGEHSRGYQSLMAVSQVFHAAELAMTTAELVPKAISAVLTQGQGDPYTAFGRMAAMAALVAGLGVAIGGAGGGSANVSKDRQAAQGAGTVLGDSSAKSDSIKRSIDLIEKNTYQDLAISSSMLTTLKSIDSNIASFASQLVRSTNITNPEISLNSGVSGANKGTAALAAVGYTAGSMVTLIGSVLGPLGALAGVLISRIPVVSKLMSSVFGGKQSVQDSGITMSPTQLAQVLASGANVKSYADIKTSGGWFSSGHTDTKSDSLSDDANRQITSIISSMASSITAAAGLIGISGDDFTNKLNSFVVDIGNVSLKDLKGEELQKALESIFSKLGDQMAAYAVGGLEKLQQVGEGYLETLARVATEYQTVDVVFQSFGKAFGTVGLASIEARDRLVQLAGGLDKFTSQGEYFLTNFFTDAEQAAALKARIDPTLSQYGLSTEGPDASKLFRDFVVGIDTTTEAGAKAYTELTAIAQAFHTVVDAAKGAAETQASLLELQAQIYELTGDKAGAAAVLQQQHVAALRDTDPALREATQKLWDLQAAASAIDKVKADGTALVGDVDKAYSVLQGVVAREKAILQTRIDAETKVVDRLKSLSESIHSTLDSLDPPGTEELSRSNAQAQIRAALATAQSGAQMSDAQVTALKKAFSTVTKDSAAQFGSYNDYLRDFLSTRNDLAQLGDVTDDQLSTEQKSLDALNAQVKQMDEMLAAEQEQINVLKGISTVGLSIDQGIQALNGSIAKAMTNPSVAGVSAISGAYASALGRAPDAAGLDYWQNQAAAGVPIKDIVNTITSSAEAQVQKLYQSLLGRPADAGGLSFYLASGASAADIEKSIKGSDEYKKLHPFAIGTNQVPNDMPAFIHKDERIIPAADNRELMRRLASPSSNSNALAAAVDRLTAKVEQQNAVIERQQRALDAIAKNTGEHKDMFDNATAGGGPLLVEIAE